MLKKQKEYILAFFLLVGFFIVSYMVFSNYQPKAIKQVSEVKGYATTDANSLNLPYPDGAEKIATSSTKNSEQTTFHSTKTKEEIYNYYKNIMLNKKWTLTSDGAYNDFTIARYDNGDKKVTIITFDESDKASTLTSIEIQQNQ